ncbi:putative plastid-lipid-associated protein 4, chloroplastic [Symbiodinium microadriaticum]|uniref:Putative plastid-lipid-associated protein 4, chloroplastic n=1 Tax=Symbiodinium microadriaticum TaxID=2951 RepID=A0A1Q9D435_SYMMI|nr:putative plastid-lipid-associated protein 4, chloroplastic [Symbiodinium microadriaticum]
MARSSRLRQIFCCLALALLALLPRAFVAGVPVQVIERRLAPVSATKRSRTTRKAADPAVVLDSPVLAASVTAAGLAAFAAFQAFQGQRRATLKQELLAAVEASQRGVDEAQNDRIGGLFAELEALNPTAEPLASSQLKGDWELLWTTSSLGRPPFFRPVEDRPILQYLDPAGGVARNLEFTPLGPNRVDAETWVEGLEKTTVGVRFKVFTLFGLLPIQAPDSATGILQVTYLDENLRLSRGDRGNLFVLRKVSSEKSAKFVPPRPDADAPDDSDEEFEHELLAFEQRFIILEEGPAGLDILASNLSKDKLNLEKRLKSSNETVDSLTASVGEWRRLSEEKDLEISDLSTKLDQMMREHAALEEAIAQKRREIEQQVAEEKAALEAKVQELQLECDNARAISDGMDKASNRVQKAAMVCHIRIIAPAIKMMKFGKLIKRVAPPSHLNQYVAYDVLKKAIVVLQEAEKKHTAEEASGTGAGVASTDEKEVSEAFGNSTTSASGQPPESRFYELINHEMQKVNRHFSLQLRSIVDNLKEAQAALFQHVKAGGGGDNLPVAAKFLQTAADVLVELDNYRSLNKTAFRKIAKKFDKGLTTKKPLSKWFMPQLEREQFVAYPLDSMLLALALGFGALRRFQPSPPAPQPRKTSGEERTTTLVLNSAGHLRALCTLVKNFDLVFPPQQGHLASTPESMSGEGLTTEFQKLIRAMGMGIMQSRLYSKTSTVYFDSPSAGFPMYQKLLAKDGPNGSFAAFRCRQTGNGEGSDLVELDRSSAALDVHAFTPVQQLGSPEAFVMEGRPDESSMVQSVKAAAEGLRAKLSAKDASLMSSLGSAGCSSLDRFAEQVASVCVTPGFQDDDRHPDDDGGYGDGVGDDGGDCDDDDGDGYDDGDGDDGDGDDDDDDDAADDDGDHDDGDGYDCDHGDYPVATIGASRHLLRGGNVRIAFDQDIQYTGSLGTGVVQEDQAMTFPFCLIEVAGEDLASTPAWLEELRQDASLRQIPNFNVGAYVLANLYHDKVSPIPTWYETFSESESFEKQDLNFALQSRADAREAQEAAANTQAWRRSIRLVAPQEEAALANPAAQEDDRIIEPKNLLASERTMLEWMHTVFALAVVAIGLWRYSLHGHMKHTNGTEESEEVRGLWLNTASKSRIVLGCYALFLVLLSVCFTWYAVISHLQRIKAMVKNEQSERIFNRRTGPVLFACSLGLALLVHLALQMDSPH